MLEEIAEIIKESRPGCNQARECWTDCGPCGARRVLELVIAYLDNPCPHTDGHAPRRLCSKCWQLLEEELEEVQS